MNTHIINTVVFVACCVGAIGCQNQPLENHVNNNETNQVLTPQKSSNNKVLSAPCKSYSSPLIQDKSKIKAMLLKEGIINNNMSEEEKTIIINKFIKNKSNNRCKPVLKKAVITPLLENTYYV